INGQARSVAHAGSKDGYRSACGDLIDGGDAEYIRAHNHIIHDKQITGTIKGQIRRLVQSGGKDALPAVPGEFKDLAAIGIPSRPERVLRGRVGTDPNNRRQTRYPAE